MNQSILESDPIGSDHSSRSWQMFNAFKCISTQQSMTGVHAMKSCRGYLFNVSQALASIYTVCLFANEFCETLGFILAGLGPSRCLAELAVI